MAETFSTLSTGSEFASSIPHELKNSTTYAGSDIQVYAYKDLGSLLGEYKPNTDNPVMQEEKVIERDIITQFTETQGIVSKGTGNQEAYHKPKPTNATDVEYTQSGQIISSSKPSIISGIGGIDSVLTKLGTLHSINYSTFREKSPVRALGRSHVKKYTRGSRTTAGTMIFTILQSHELIRFANSGNSRPVATLDQIDPFNLILFFENEFGSLSTMYLFGVDINTESQSMSIDDLTTINTMNYFAKDMLPMEETGNVFKSTHEMLHGVANDSRLHSYLERVREQLSGLRSLDAAITGDKSSDTRLQKLFKRSRGLF